MKNLLIVLIFIVATALPLMAQTAKAPARKPTAVQTPAKSPASTTRTALPNQSKPIKTPPSNATALPNKNTAKPATNSATGSGGGGEGNATKLPAGSGTVAPTQPAKSNYTAPSKSAAPTRSSSSYRAPSRRSSGGLAFDEGNHLLNVGLGLGYSGYYASALPIGASYEYGITPDISIGAQFDVASFSYYSSYYYYGYYSSDRYLATYFGGRGSYHFNRILNLDSDKLDIYAGAGVGYRSYGGYQDYYLPISINGFLGGRFFFSNSVGGFVELGYTGLSYSKVGLSFKF